MHGDPSNYFGFSLFYFTGSIYKEKKMHVLVRMITTLNFYDIML